MKEYSHNGEPVIVQTASPGKFEKFLQKEEIEYGELPYLDSKVRVLRYTKEGCKRYAVIRRWSNPEDCGEDIYITGSVPEDSWKDLIRDVDDQMKGGKPQKIKTRRELAVRYANAKAYRWAEKKTGKKWMRDFFELSDEWKKEYNFTFRAVMAQYGYDVTDEKYKDGRKR